MINSSNEQKRETKQDWLISKWISLLFINICGCISIISEHFVLRLIGVVFIIIFTSEYCIALFGLQQKDD
jgi:Na+(H+)/acetate symporter ActP